MRWAKGEDVVCVGKRGSWRKKEKEVMFSVQWSVFNVL